MLQEERNTKSYNDVHLCGKAQTTASNRQSSKAELFVDMGYMKTQYVKCCYRELLKNGFTHQLVGVHRGCLLSSSLFNIFLEDILTHALDNNNDTISNGGGVVISQTTVLPMALMVSE